MLAEMRIFYIMEDKINKPDFNNSVINYYYEYYNSISTTYNNY
jgi:hypothetical protein